MIEIFAEAIHPVVTIQTSASIGKVMGSHERQVPLTMTGVANIGIEFGYIVGMAIMTGERFPHSRKLMTV